LSLLVRPTATGLDAVNGNTANGELALVSNTTGSNNIAAGYLAGACFVPRAITMYIYIYIYWPPGVAGEANIRPRVALRKAGQVEQLEGLNRLNAARYMPN
jgi:hypothetical protein